WRRQHLYDGALMVFRESRAIAALVEHAREMIEDAFAPHDPRRIHEALPVEACVRILAQLKPEFIHHRRSKELVGTILAEFGCELDETYFDVPRLRTAM